MIKLFKTALFSLFFAGICLVSAHAADNDISSIDFNRINKQLEKIDNALKNDSLTSDKIDEYISYLSEQDADLGSKRKNLNKDIQYIQKQLDALGEPQEGAAEDKVITKQRTALSSELTATDRVLKEADLLTVKIEDLNAQILNARSKKVYGDLITKQSALINPMVFFNSLKLYAIFFWDITKSPIDWYQSVPKENRSYTILSIVSMALILIAALAVAIILRKYILNHWGYKEDIELPHFSRKVVAAVAVAIARGLIPDAFVGACMIWMVSTKIFGDSLLGHLLIITGFSSFLAIIEATISRVTFAPHYQQWRLINIPNDKALLFTRVIFLFVICNAIATIQVIVAQKTNYPVDTVHFLTMVSCAIKAFFLIWIIKIAVDTYREMNTVSVEQTSENDDETDSLDSGFKIMVASNLLLATTFGLSLVGYPELSSFILRNLILSAIICGVFELFRRAFIDILKRLILASPWMKTIRVTKRNISKIEFWLTSLINPVLVLTLIFILLNLWGLPGDFMLQMGKKLLFGFKIGGVQISLIAIAFGILVFFISLTIVKLIKKNLANNVFNNMDIDDGIKHSLVSGISFVGFIISTLLAIIAVGVDLTNLAFIAGALSVGIGFGLQDVIKNLVSGIIILFERPFKVGDWVIMNGTEGKIKQINIRSTEMESFNRTSVIVPNATLLSSSIVNLTHGDNISRQSVSVGVAYGSDVEKVRKILLECALNHKYVMKNPAPYVLFKDFSDSSLNFELRCYTNDIWKGWVVPSDLRFTINKRFIEEGIEIPFPQIVVHSGEKVAQENQFYALKKGEQ
ncbi:MAG: mechanosensitive ion channel [Pseudomonadota bacterium]|nr:mechanosensitive ion channel [Pseudomonadota bacterium]